MPPWRQIGFRIEPIRARPVPFCFQGLRPLPLTSARFFVMWVPRRSAAFEWITDSQITAPFTRPAKISSLSSSDPTFLLSELTTSIFISSQFSVFSFQFVRTDD